MLYHPDLAKKRGLIVFTVMLVAILEVLDSTIINVTLPNMMPALSANQEEITWVLTAYLLASAMMIPLTGLLSRCLGHRRLLLINITGFMLSSFCCGSAHSLSAAVLFRFLQGGCGAALIPLSQSILRSIFSKKEQRTAMAIWGIGIMAAPALGPSLGGLITEIANWRWVFYVNTPVCLLGLLLVCLVIKPSKLSHETLDYWGIASMFTAAGCMQLALDQGNMKDWFHSNVILSLTLMSVLALVFFLIRTARYHSPIIHLKIFKDRNFTVSTISLAIFSGILFANIVLQPIMLETLFDYTPILAGISLSPLGLSAAISMGLSAYLMKYLDFRFLLIAALLSGSSGMLYLAHLNLAATDLHFMIANMMLGAGLGLFMVPLVTHAFITLDAKYSTEGAGLFSYGRMLGTSVGISLFSTLLSRQTQIHWNQLGLYISPLHNNLRLWLVHAHKTLQDLQTPAILQKQLFLQSSMIAFINIDYIMALCFLALIPLVLFIKN